jgi:hypothetical protein
VTSSLTKSQQIIQLKETIDELKDTQLKLDKKINENRNDIYFLMASVISIFGLIIVSKH